MRGLRCRGVEYGVTHRVEGGHCELCVALPAARTLAAEGSRRRPQRARTNTHQQRRLHA